ncbi:MAG: hypothetical protein AABY16_02940 [Nanoarchaeota archaeon]
MSEKRGFGHVEAILSFVIFIAFLVFAFIFFSPFQSGRTLTSSLDYAWREVADASNIDLEIYSVYINSANQIIAIAIPGAPAMNATVEDSNSNAVASYTDLSGNVNFQKPPNNFVRIKFGEDFVQGNLISGILLANTEYTVSSSETNKVFSEKKLFDLNASYYAGYSTLKTNFNLPNRVDFGFTVGLSNINISASKEIPENVEVLSKNDRVAVVRIPSGVIEYADVGVFVW